MLEIPPLEKYPTLSLQRPRGSAHITFTATASARAVERFAYQAFDVENEVPSEVAYVTVYVQQQQKVGEEPLIASNSEATTLEGREVSISLVASHPETGAAGIEFAIAGSLTCSQLGWTFLEDPSTGLVSYTPQPYLVGSDVFGFRATLAGCSKPSCTSSARVTVSITAPVARPPALLCPAFVSFATAATSAPALEGQAGAGEPLRRCDAPPLVARLQEIRPGTTGAYERSHLHWDSHRAYHL